MSTELNSSQMNQLQQIESVTADWWVDRLQGTNINSVTLLATDYLNHFNEVIILIKMVADMPDMIEDVLAWEPKSYWQHFADSGFKDKKLAIEAYVAAPEDLKALFDARVACLNGNIFKTQQRLKNVDPEALEEALAEYVRVSIDKFHRLVEMINSVVNGGTVKATPAEAEASCA
jgi:hypothetical protein